MNVKTVRNRLNSILNSVYFLLEHLPENGELQEDSAFTIRTYTDEIIVDAGCIEYIIKCLEGVIDEE